MAFLRLPLKYKDMTVGSGLIDSSADMPPVNAGEEEEEEEGVLCRSPANPIVFKQTVVEPVNKQFAVEEAGLCPGSLAALDHRPRHHTHTNTHSSFPKTTFLGTLRPGHLFK